jgi:gliding motility-associated-like protein
MIKTKLILFVFLILTGSYSIACTACQALSNISQNLNGNTLELNFTSNAGWQCCYTVQIEIVCASSNFTGTPNYFSPELCINGGSGASSTWAFPEAYPTTYIDVSNFCPGTYKWRARETVCGLPWTSEYTFTISGASPMVVDASTAADTVCLGQSTQLSASASNGCNGPYSYSWSPTAGLTGANTANPTATPNATTTYTVTVTEPGSCATTQTQQVTVYVNPLPTAQVDDNVAVCLNDASPTVTFTGAGGTAPYTINYTLNGVAQPTIVTNGDTYTLNAPTNTVGFYNYQLVNVTDASSTACTQNQNTYITVTVWDLPVVSAGPDVEICEPNPVSPSEVTLNGSGAGIFTWDNGITNGVAFVPPTGVTTYTVTGTDANGCTDTDQVNVIAYPMPVALGSAGPVYGNAPITTNFANFSQNANSFLWDFGNGNSETASTTMTISETFEAPGTYLVTLTASNGICWDTTTFTVFALPPMVVTPPNIFTPNGDGANDEYFVTVLYGEKFEAEIFNRWGNKLANLQGINDGWDGTTENGKEVEDGVYFILYKATDYNDNIIEGHTYFHLVR